MNESCKIKKLKENLKIKNALNEIGIYGMIGPTGPRGMPGTSINIKGSFNSLAELIKTYPQGVDGDTYIINGDLYYWNQQNMDWENAGRIEGPTGPKGDIGPTGPQGMKGDTGEKGLKGDIGPQGPQGSEGPKGNDGATGPTGPQGIKGDTGEQGPRGDIGPQGPTGIKGDKGGIAAYAERYMHTQKTEILQANVEKIIELDTNGPVLNASYTTENAITIDEVGIYKIDYLLTVEPLGDAVLTLGVKCNDSIINGSDISGDGTADYFTQLSGTVITQLNPDDILTLIIKASTSATLSFNGSTNAKLSIIKLN